MFERFTESARQVVVFAQEEARGLGHDHIATEHLLLGLLRHNEGLAARVLDSFDVSIEETRRMVTRIVGEGHDVVTGQIPFTPRGKKALDLSLREALALGHNYVGTEHLLLGVIRENEGVGARVLLNYADPEKIRDEIVRMLSGPRRLPDKTSNVDREASVGSVGVIRSVDHAFRLRLIVTGWALFGVACGIGLLAGWLIWG